MTVPIRATQRGRDKDNRLPVCEMSVSGEDAQRFVEHFDRLSEERGEGWTNAFRHSVQWDIKSEPKKASLCSIEVGEVLFGKYFSQKDRTMRPFLSQEDFNSLFTPQGTEVKIQMRVTEYSHMSPQLSCGVVIAKQDGGILEGTAPSWDYLVNGFRKNRTRNNFRTNNGFKMLWIRNSSKVLMFKCMVVADAATLSGEFPFDDIKDWQEDEHGRLMRVQVLQRALPQKFRTARIFPSSCREALEEICEATAITETSLLNNSLVKKPLQAVVDKAYCQGYHGTGCNHIHWGACFSYRKRGDSPAQPFFNLTPDDVLSENGFTPPISREQPEAFKALLDEAR